MSQASLTNSKSSAHGRQEDRQGGRDGAVIRFENLGKQFYSRQQKKRIEAIRGVDLNIERGEFVCIVGPSGCGKSTLLNLVAGLLDLTSGTGSFEGAPIPQPNTQVGYITQKDNLMPWRTVRRNITLPLELRSVDKSEWNPRADAIAEIVGLTGFRDSYPRELSGGMRKRVTLARTLVYDPDVLLADEPFGALDAQLKLVLAEELLRLWGGENGDVTQSKTVVYVTHDIGEAITLADRVIVMSRRPGRIRLDRSIDLERPRDVYSVRFTPEYTALLAELWDALREDVRAGEEI